MERSQARAVKPADVHRPDRQDAARALARLPDADLLRLEALARLRARGLPAGVSWADLLHEAIVRVLDGSRQWPAGVPLVAFLAQVMRSIGSEIWQRCRRETALAVPAGTEERGEPTERACPAGDPERILAAGEAVAAIYRLFAGDTVVLRIISGLADGRSAEEIRVANGFSETEYDSARKRMRRALLRYGFAGDGR